MIVKAELKDIASRLDELAASLTSLATTDKAIAPLQAKAADILDRLNAIIEAWNADSGKGTSERKKASSRANAKRGGRLPKSITDARKRLATLKAEQEAHIVDADSEGNVDLFADVTREQAIAELETDIARQLAELRAKRAAASVITDETRCDERAADVE